MMSDREPLEAIQIGQGEKRLVPTPPAPAEPPAPRKSIPWKKIGERLAAALSAFPKLLLLLSFVALVGFTIAELRRDVVVIEPIRMPEALRKRGYSEDVAADRLWDEVGRIKERTPTAKDPVDVQPASQRMNFEPPGSGIALQEVVQMLRRFLRLKETRIAGEFTCMTTACKPEELTLTLRVLRGRGMEIISVPPLGDRANEGEIGPYFHAAALDLLRELDPYVVAFFLYQTDSDAARSEALRLIAPTHPQRKWALNLLGFIAADDGKYDRAIYWYRRAVAANKKDKFAAIAYTNWGNAHVAKDELTEGIEQFELAARLDPKNAFARNSWGLALVAQGETAGAIEQFTHATKLDSKYAGAYNNWGTALLAKGELAESMVRVTLLAEAIEKFTLAIELDPDYAVAYNNWGSALGQTGEPDQAIEKFTRAIELDPSNAVAYNNWGSTLGEMGERDQAIEKFTRAAELDENYAAAYNNWGLALLANDETAEAIEKFTLATELDEKYADQILNIALALRRLSDSDEPADAFQRYAGDAADAFESYLVLVPESPRASWIRKRIDELRADPTNN